MILKKVLVLNNFYILILIITADLENLEEFLQRHTLPSSVGNNSYHNIDPLSTKIEQGSIDEGTEGFFNSISIKIKINNTLQEKI